MARADTDAATSVPRPSGSRVAPAATRSRPKRRLAPPFVAARRRLVAINLAVVTAILAVMAVAVYVADAHAIDQQIDQELVNRVSRDGASDVTALLGGQASSAPVATQTPAGERVPPDGADTGEQYEPASPNVFALGLDRRGHVIYDPGHVVAATMGLPDLAAARPVLAGTSAATRVTLGAASHAYRLYTVPLIQHGAIIGALQVGTSLDTRDRQLDDLLFTLAAVGLAVMALTALASVYLADRALEPARRAFDQQRQFAAAASHELRTPLAFVRSQGDLILGQLARSPHTENLALSEDMGDLVDEVDYMARLVRDLLLLARDAHDGRALAWQRVDLAALARDVADRTQAMAAARELAISADLPPAGDHEAAIVVRGDGDRLRQLLLILVENAVKYTPAGGRVEVRVRVKAAARGALLSHLSHTQRAEIEVRDTGIGISPEHLEAIFAPFYQGDPARSAASLQEHRGAGLGLALARWIVEAHGGSITVESAVGEGSAFRVALPLADAD